MTAIFLELAERWTYPLFTASILLLIIAILATGITRVAFLIVLAVTTAHFLLVQAPDVANHVNLAIYCNVVMMIGIVYSLVHDRDLSADDDCLAMMRPLLQSAAVLMYFLAGFHKLNADFVDPEVSCVPLFMGDLAAIVRYRLPDDPTASVVVAWLVIGAELIGGLLLAVPRFQLPVLVFAWTMHAVLALIHFVDFAALALAILFTFVPSPWVERLNGRARTLLYVAICVVAGAVTAPHDLAWYVDVRLVAGIVFNAAALVFLWPVLRAFASRTRPAWAGISLVNRMTPRWMFVFPVLLVLHGMTSYLGLRTAGNFSMFSNLRTEGERSNHFLLSGNPLKFWSYQEDVVRFISIDDRRHAIGHQYQALQGYDLPVVEFRKLIYLWTRAGATVPMVFEYQGKVHSTQDIVNHDVWRTGARDWEMALMDFRIIQPEGANECRW
jgi:hypothetical protein